VHKNRMASAASGISMALQGGCKVAVYGVFERTGLVVSWDVANNSPYSAVVQMPVGFAEKNGKLKWNFDGSPPGIPAAVEAVETALPGYIKGCILASEAPAEPAEIEYICNCLPDLEKVVYLSSASAGQKDSVMNKMNPFSKAEIWYEAEEAVKVVASNLGIEYTIVRTGGLKGGPYFQSNPEFQGALEDNLFDIQKQAFKVSTGDDLDGNTSRDLASTALVAALGKDIPCFTVVSEESGPLKCSVKNRMDIKLDAAQERTVYTPSSSDWDAALSQL